jgi:hypothetical protein
MTDGERPADGDLPGIDYPALMRAALLDVVREVLARVAASGLPGDHHFLLSFGTAEDGVVMPQRLRRQFPDELTIVLQHQFWGLEVDASGFSVTLRFSGSPERLVVPWSALRTFADPSVGFGLRLRPEREPDAASTPERPQTTPPAEASPAEAAPPPPRRGKVVDLGSFRRKGGDGEAQG